MFFLLKNGMINTATNTAKERGNGLKSLIIAEKPSVAADIARVLGVRQRRNGYIEGDPYVITWAVGHLINLKEPEDYDPRYKKWQYADLPILPREMGLKPYPQTEAQLNILRTLAERADVGELICATDSGREGELIFRYIYHYINCQKPVKRLWISSMTDEAISEGFQKLKDSREYNNLYYSAKCRSEADWLVGINATRAYTTLYSDLFSVGRVQTPTLALIVDREEELTNFVPKDYFEAAADLESQAGSYEGIWFEDQISETKIMAAEKAEAIAAKVKGKSGKITEIEKKNQKQKPPLLYDLTELQRQANKEFGLTAQEVLDTAQLLYEKHKLLTYPRTDSRYLSEDMKQTVYDTMRSIDVPPFQGAIAKLKEGGEIKLNFTKRIIDNKKITDHHAIIPTKKVPVLKSLNERERRIYQMVVKRFLAVFYPDHEFQTIKVITLVEGETFVSKGKTIKAEGWKWLYQKPENRAKLETEAAPGGTQLPGGKNETDTGEDGEAEEAAGNLPPLRKGQAAAVTNCRILKKQTTPPKPYTEATLLSAMENAGRFVEDEELKEQLKESSFGTPATRAGIIERLLKVGYIQRQGKTLRPTEKGKTLIRMVPKSLRSPETTGKWERGLSKINRGELKPEIFMETIQKFVAHLVQNARRGRTGLQSK